MTSRVRFAATCILVAGAIWAYGTGARVAEDTSARTHLTWSDLVDGDSVGDVDFAAYAPPSDADVPGHVFEGSLRISGKPHTRAIHADADFLTRARILAARSFPDDFDFEFVQDGGVLLPVRRGYIVTDHSHWDVVLEPGRIWDEPGDHGYTRVALPFALVQKHMNCTHYGVITFLFNDDRAVLHAAMQVSSETCKYLKFDMWGLLDASYTPHPVSSKHAVIAAYRQNRSHQLPTRPVAQLANDHPGVDPSALAIGEANARTFYGLVVDGINYVSPCPTRRGNYPYCDVLPFPSYSTAKSAEAALAMMEVEKRHPGAVEVDVSGLAPVPGCAAPGWNGITFRNLLDMTTGRYDSTGYMADEDAPKVQSFFYATTEQDKANFSCNAYPRQAPAGGTWVYHTSDTFLLGDALSRFLRSLPGHERADVFRDVVAAQIYEPLGLSATARVTRRTTDAAAQAFFGYGLQFHRDDIARLALFIGKGHGRIDGRQVLDPHMLDLAMQRIDGQRGAVVTSYSDFRYQLGFWARDVAPLLGCTAPTWVPFMSGFGGISVVIFPNGVVYYNVSDSGSAAAFDWGKVASEARKLGDYCQPRAQPAEQ